MMSGRMALSVIAVSISVSPFFTDEVETAMFMTSAPRRLPAISKERLRAGRGFEEQVDQRAAAQRRRAFCSDWRLIVGGLVGEVEQELDLVRRQPLDVRRWRCGKWSGSTLATALVIKGVSIGRVSAAGKPPWRGKCAYDARILLAQ